MSMTLVPHSYVTSDICHTWHQLAAVAAEHGVVLVFNVNVVREDEAFA